MRETLQDIYDTSADRAEAETALKRLCSWMTRSRLEPMKEFARQIRRHWRDILAYFDHPYTNAILEGLNSVIQNVKTRARGFKNMDYFSTMIYLTCANSTSAPSPPDRPTHTKQRKAKKNNHYIPKFLLKQWSEDGKSIYMYDTIAPNADKPLWCKSFLRSTASEKGMYVRQGARRRAGRFLGMQVRQRGGESGRIRGRDDEQVYASAIYRRGTDSEKPCSGATSAYARCTETRIRRCTRLSDKRYTGTDEKFYRHR